jgi:dienelactone hydrolase
LRLTHPDREAAARRIEVLVGVRANGRALIVDLTLPPRGQGPWSTVLLVHGAAPDTMGLPFRASGLYRDWGSVLAAKGLAALMLDHTLGWPDLRPDQALDEIDQALAWLAGEGPAHGADATRLGAMIASAGGVLAGELLAGPRPLRIRTAALFSPMLAAPAERPARPGEAADTLARMDLAACAGEVAAAGARLLMLRAGADAPVMLEAFDAAALALLRADADVHVRNLPGAPHAFEALVDAPWVSAAIDEAVRFLRE